MERLGVVLRPADVRAQRGAAEDVDLQRAPDEREIRPRGGREARRREPRVELAQETFLTLDRARDALGGAIVELPFPCVQAERGRRLGRELHQEVHVALRELPDGGVVRCGAVRVHGRALGRESRGRRRRRGGAGLLGRGGRAAADEEHERDAKGDAGAHRGLGRTAMY